MRNLINKITDPSAAARVIAKEFPTHDVASKFVTQIKKKGEEVLVDTHPKFVNCISRKLRKKIGK